MNCVLQLTKLRKMLDDMKMPSGFTPISYEAHLRKQMAYFQQQFSSASRNTITLALVVPLYFGFAAHHARSQPENVIEKPVIQRTGDIAFGPETQRLVKVFGAGYGALEVFATIGAAALYRQRRRWFDDYKASGPSLPAGFV
jgi:hypothetical protein